MRDVVIAGYLRSPQSRSRPKNPERDWLHSLRADDLLASVIKALLERTEISPDQIDDFLVGCAFGVTENWSYGGRTPVFLSNLNETVPAKFIDMQCGSGMAAVHTGFLEIAAGYADVVLATGMEHMTRVPMGPTLFKQGTISVNPRLFSEEFAHWDLETSMNMGLTAEKLARQTGISREDMDRWGVRSHMLAVKARESGFFEDEILPFDLEQPEGGTRRIASDQAVREDVTLESMSGLTTPFDPDGVITPGNASPLNAGAAAMLLMSAETAMARGIEPLALIRSLGFAGVDPTVMGRGPVPAVTRALDRAGLTVEDIDCWEINEAFSVVALHCIRELSIDEDLVNVMGGGLALGHPLGATGVRLVGTLSRILRKRQDRYGCATACVGGGQGVATILESYPT
jgi:acetyl-CoA C-acetyltransferase